MVGGYVFGQLRSDVQSSDMSGIDESRDAA